MRYQIATSAIMDDSLVIGLFSDQAAHTLLNKNQQASIQQILSLGDFQAKAGQVTTQYHVPGFAAKRVIFVGLGKELEYSLVVVRKAMLAVGKALVMAPMKKCCILLPRVKDQAMSLVIRQAIINLEDANMRRDQLKREQEPMYWPEQIIFVDEDDSAAAGVTTGEAIANGMKLTRYLGDLPANHCTPIKLAEKAAALAKEHSELKVEIYDENQIRDLKMGCFLAVAAGSQEPPRMIVMQYQGGAENDAPTVLVGKGVTFDTGGICIKPGPRMDEMKYDMCGAATVIGAMKAAAEMKLPMNLIGVVVATENMPSGAAVKPGDVVTSMSGQTVEILNTDAEGRLILCDALTFVERFKPKEVIDIATLTGAIIVTLGSKAAGIMGNNQALIDKVIAAGEHIGDRAWQLPIWDEYQELTNSAFADVANLGNDEGKSITAACFLSRFAKAYPWAHLDIAGIAWKGGGNMGRAASGRPVPMVMQYLLEQLNLG